MKGKLKCGKYEYNEGDLLAVVEFFSERPMEDVIMAIQDSTVAMYEVKDLEDDSLFQEVLMYILSEIEGVLGIVKRDVVKDLEMGADLTKIAETVSGAEEEEYALEAIEKMLTFRELPNLPDSEERALEIIDKINVDEDPLRYTLHGLAFAKKFPDSIETPKILLEVSKVYMEKMGDRHGAKYALKLLFLFQPNSEILNSALRYIVKVLRIDLDPEWFEYLIRLLIHFPEEEVSLDEIA